MTKVPVLLILFGAAIATPAQAACEGSASFTVHDAYLFADIAEFGDDDPVVITSETIACDGFYLNHFSSTTLSTEGTYGNRGFGDEHDFALGYEGDVGEFTVDASVAYWKVAPFSSTHNDIVSPRIRVSRPVESEEVTITPYLETFAWLGVNGYPDQVFVRPGIGVSVQLSPRCTVDADVSASVDLTNDRTVFRPSISITRGLGNGWSVTAGVQSSNQRRAFGLGLNKNF